MSGRGGKAIEGTPTGNSIGTARTQARRKGFHQGCTNRARGRENGRVGN